MKEKVLSLLLVCFMIITLMPKIVYAETTYDISVGDVVISSGGDYIISGNTIVHTIKVEPGVTGVNITLDNANIDVSAIDDACALDIGDEASVTVTLKAGTNNMLKSGSTKAGIKVETPAAGTPGSLVIDGTGHLIVVGGRYRNISSSGIESYGAGAGIGSNGSKLIDGQGPPVITMQLQELVEGLLLQQP